MKTENISESHIKYRLQIAVQKQKLGQLDEAETIYRKILQSQFEQHVGQQSLGDIYKQAILNFGVILQQQGKLTEALKLYEQTLIIEPNFAEVYNNLGNVFLKQGQSDLAIKCYQKALSIKPDFANAHNNLGNALKEYDLDAAIQSYQQALKFQPDWAEALYNLGTSLNEQGNLEASKTCFEQALKIKPDLAAAKFGICMNQLPIIYSYVDEIQWRRNQYQQNLIELAQHYKFAPAEEQVEMAKVVGYLQPFYLTYQGFNDRYLQLIYGEMICQLMARCYPQWGKVIPIPELAAHEKIRVGFVSGFFREHSNWKIPIRGWVENLDKSEFELFGYHTSSLQDLETLTAAKLFDKFTQGPLLLEQWANIIERDRLHVLIFPEFGMDSMTIRLGCLRLAPIQITSWGHPETSGMPTIDYYLSSALMEPENAQAHYTEKLVRLPNLSFHYTPKEIQRTTISKRDIGIADDEAMFWCCQSLYKYLPQYDDVFPQIASYLSKCKFVFIKHHASEQITTVFSDRLKQAFEGFGLNYQDYCIFLPRLEPKTFTATTAIADVFLDSIGWSGCNSTLEALAYDIPIVTMPGELMRGRHTMAILTMMGIDVTIATNIEDYVQIAVRLGQDAQYRQQISQLVAQNKHLLSGDLEPVTALENFLLKLFKKSRKCGSIATRLLQQANQCQRTHGWAEAEHLYHQVLEIQPNQPEALYGLGTIAIQLGQIQAAEQWLSAAAQIQPDVKVWFSLGNVRQALGKWLQAQEAYQQAIAIRPDAAPIYNNLGYTLEQQGFLDEAIAYYQKALAVQPNCIEADVNLGNALHKQGKLSKERQAYYAQLNHKLAVQRENAGDLKMATAYYQQAIAIQPIELTKEV